MDVTREQCERAAETHQRNFVGDQGASWTAIPGVGCVWVYPYHFQWNPMSTSVDCSSSYRCICADPPDASVKQDPHFWLAHGGRADFRGKHNTMYNFLSAQNMSMNIKTENATFRLGNLTVHGSFITEAHVAMRTHQGRHFNVSFWASELNAQVDAGWRQAGRG